MDALPHIRSLSTYSAREFMGLDAPARRNLELTASLARRRPAADRCSACWTRPARRWAAACCAAGWRSRCSTPSGSRAGMEAVEALRGDAHPARRPARSLLHGMGDMERLISPRRRGARPTPATWSRCRTALLRVPELAARVAQSRTAVAPLPISRVALDCRRTSRALLDRAHRGRARRSTLRDGGLIRPGYNAELDALQAASQRREDVDRRTGGARAGAHRHRVAQGRLQQGLRLLHRSHEVEPGHACRPTTSASRRRERRALHHARPEGVRGAHPRRGGEEHRAGVRAVSRRCASAWRAGSPARSCDVARAVAELDVLAALRRAAAREPLLSARTWTTSDVIEIAAGGIPSSRRSAQRAASSPTTPCSMQRARTHAPVITGPNMAASRPTCARSR